MTNYTTYTIVMPGNRFGDYLSDTIDRNYYTKWQVRVLTQGRGNLEAKRLSDVTVKAANLSANEIISRTIDRTKEFYDDYFDAQEYPGWLNDLEKNSKGADKND